MKCIVNIFANEKHILDEINKRLVDELTKCKVVFKIINHTEDSLYLSERDVLALKFKLLEADLPFCDFEKSAYGNDINFFNYYVSSEYSSAKEILYLSLVEKEKQLKITYLDFFDHPIAKLILHMENVLCEFVVEKTTVVETFYYER
jgi:hypothetical protein